MKILIIFLLCAALHPAKVMAQEVTGRLTLTEAIELAKQRSHDAMLARLSLMGQYWSYRSFKAELMPSVNLSGRLLGFDRSMAEARNYEDGRIRYVENNSLTNNLTLSVDQNIAALGGKLSVQSSLYRLDQFSYDTKLYNSQPLRLSYTQPLRAYNSLKWEGRTAPLKFEKAKCAYIESMEGVTVEVVRLFFDVLSAQSVYKQCVSYYEDRERLFGVAKKRFDLGTVTKSEMLQLELSLLNAKVEMNQNLITLNDKLFKLFSYLRVANYGGVELVPPFSIPQTDIRAGEVLEKALSNSSHPLEQRIDLLESEKALAQAKANRGLQMQLSSEIGFNKTANHFSDAYRKLRDNEVIGLSLSLPIFDWGVSRGKVKMAESDLEVTKTRLEQNHEEYVQNLRTSVMQFNMQAEQCRNAQRAQDIADERYDIMKRRFEAGTVSVTELNTAQQESESARAQYINQLQTYWSGYYSLRKATLYDWIMRRDITVDFDEIFEK